MFSPMIRARLALLLGLAATPAHAAGGLYLRWGDCPLGGAGTAVEGFTCDSEAGIHELYCAMQMPQTVDSVLALEIVVDIQHEAAALPDWWRFDFAGCHGGKLSADDHFGPTTCGDFWSGQAAGGLLSYTVGMPGGAPNQARMVIGLGVPSDQPRTLDAASMYYAARIVFSNLMTSSCTGCAGAACLVLNSILVHRPPRPDGIPSTDILLTAPGPNNGNWAGWQADSGAGCQAVPVRNVTWGAVKSLYR
jgi:hypothetical protein